MGVDREITPLIIEVGETAKNISSLESVWQQLLDAGADRRSLVINLGGGVIGDLGGFAANTYMRGVDFVQAPTTLLAQVDASVGGKLGVNFGGLKNIVGNFAQPQMVICDVSTLSTLPTAELLAGYAEVLKHGFICDSAYLKACLENEPGSTGEDTMIEIVSGSCRIKAEVVSQDEKEAGVRKILNFGHTIGHAIEALSHNKSSGWTDPPLLHGEAVSIGMVVEAKISELLGLLPADKYQQVHSALAHVGLPVSISANLSVEQIVSLTLKDKKSVSGRVNYTLLDDVGQALFDRQVDQTVVESALSAVLPARDS